MLHEICDGMDPITYALLKLRSDKSSCLGLIQAKTPRQTTLSQKAELSVQLSVANKVELTLCITWWSTTLSCSRGESRMENVCYS